VCSCLDDAEFLVGFAEGEEAGAFLTGENGVLEIVCDRRDWER
jgi:hypothetical protein